jgi:predicted lipid-binding transport protein (Tim44 family)
MGGFGGGAAQPETAPIQLDGADFNAFERLLGEINTAYSNEDEAGLRQRVTPEMFGYFDEDLTENARRGVADRVTDVKLLQGDLSEAWREGTTDYATVSMRFSLINALYDRQSGRVVDGNATAPQEVREFWTFQRERGGEWKLSGIQQAA